MIARQSNNPKQQHRMAFFLFAGSLLAGLGAILVHLWDIEGFSLAAFVVFVAISWAFWIASFCVETRARGYHPAWGLLLLIPLFLFIYPILFKDRFKPNRERIQIGKNSWILVLVISSLFIQLSAIIIGNMANTAISVLIANALQFLGLFSAVVGLSFYAKAHNRSWLWGWLGLLSLPGAAGVILLCHREPHNTGPLCSECGYDLRASPNLICPECGHVEGSKDEEKK